MLLAKRDDALIYAEPKSAAVCPHCNGEVISKCGEIKIWHWAHKVECPYHTEPETEWHLQWKKLAIEASGCEIEKRNHTHIIDAFNSSKKRAYEFQYSPISQLELKERSMDAVLSGFNINWIFNIEKYIKHIDFGRDHHSSITQYGLNNLKISWYNHRYDTLFQNGIPIYGNVFFDCVDFRENFRIIKIKALYPSGYGQFECILNKDQRWWVFL